MTEVEKRILENQQIMLDTLLFLTMKCNVSDCEIHGDMKRKQVLDQARAKTENLLKQAEVGARRVPSSEGDADCVVHFADGCEVCSNRTAWFGRFNFPYPYLSPKGSPMTLCPVCGRQLPLREEVDI